MSGMAFIVGVLEGDFDAFTQRFDSDPLDRKQAAKGFSGLNGRARRPTPGYGKRDHESGET